MLPGLDHINKAVRILQRESFTERKRVLEASRLFMESASCCGAWPMKFYGPRQRIQKLMVVQGTLDETIVAATEDELREIAHAINDFAADLYDAVC